MPTNAIWRTGILSLLAWSALALPSAGQTVEVYSEFRRIDPEGEIVVPDRGGKPREILSPALVRNGFNSFHIIVTVPHNVPFTLHIGQNPPDSMDVTLYRELYFQRGKEWIPDALERVRLPFEGLVPDDCTSVGFWLDVWVPGRGPARRLKLEPQLNVQDRWIVYPMEVRIKQARAPLGGVPMGTGAALSDPSDAAARASLISYLCGRRSRSAKSGLTVRRMIARNVHQDMALARSLESKLGRDRIVGVMLEALNAGDLKSWCAAPGFPTGQGPEWYLRIRDFLYRAEDP